MSYTVFTNYQSGMTYDDFLNTLCNKDAEVKYYTLEFIFPGGLMNMQEVAQFFSANGVEVETHIKNKNNVFFIVKFFDEFRFNIISKVAEAAKDEYNLIYDNKY